MCKSTASLNGAKLIRPLADRISEDEPHGKSHRLLPVSAFSYSRENCEFCQNIMFPASVTCMPQKEIRLKRPNPIYCPCDGKTISRFSFSKGPSFTGGCGVWQRDMTDPTGKLPGLVEHNAVQWNCTVGRKGSKSY